MDSGYANEDELEQLIAQFPNLLPGVGKDSFVCRQFETGSGPVDLLIINSKDGSIILVECKLARNTEARRKIIGQIIDYAASLRRLSFDEFHVRWKERQGPDLEEVLVDGSALALAVSENLQQSRFTLLMAVDEINEPLKQMTIYVNDKTDSTTRVALIELARHRVNEIEIMISQTFGYEAVKPDLDPYSARKPWSQEDFMSWLSKNEVGSLPLFENFMLALEGIGYVWGGTKASSPSGAVQIRTKGGWRYPLIFHTYDKATVEVPFADLKKFDFIESILQIFSNVPEINQDLIRSKNYGAIPKIALSRFSDPVVYKALIDACTMVKTRETDRLKPQI